jgi:hypothetical protein
MTAPGPPGGPFPYACAEAFGSAITDRLKVLAGMSVYSVSQLRRQLAYDRLLARLFIDPQPGWILKGGISMIARLSVARHSADIDLVAGADSPAAGLVSLREAAARDLGDFFTFRFEQPHFLVQGVEGLRVPTEAWLGSRVFERFGVDLVTGVVITGQPESATPLVALDIPGLLRPRYRLYPLADSIADKVMAITERHQGRPSTRFRDLIDLMLIAHTQQIGADDLATALMSERLRRGLPAASKLVVHDNMMWRTGYATIARDVPGLTEKSLRQARVVAKQFLDPVLGDRVDGSIWDPAALSWQP